MTKKPSKINPKSSKEDLMKELKRIKKKQEKQEKQSKEKGWIVVYSDKDTSVGFGIDTNENKALLKAKKDAKERGPLPPSKTNVTIKLGIS